MAFEPAKYQFAILEYNTTTNNSAATKAVLDCNRLFTQKGYQNYTLTFHNNSKRGVIFYSKVFFGICSFLAKAKNGAIVGVQYPLLNNVFKYFILLSRLKRIKFFCVIHDVESLRTGGKDKAVTKREAANFNYYSCLIVHNDRMKQWLIENGVTKKMVPLTMFDYLVDENNSDHGTFSNTIVYAGNLGKSRFIYQLGFIYKWKFNLYGPNFNEAAASGNTIWKGVFSPEQIVHELTGAYGLIWDGDDIYKADEVLGNYLKYNNPHKFSLYIAAGLPVITPSFAAIASFIKEKGIGLVIDDLNCLNQLNITSEEYAAMKANVAKLQYGVIKGDNFLAALSTVEQQLN